MGKNKKIIILLIYVFSFGSLASAHPYYLSLCIVDYNREASTLEISVKIFADDLLIGLESITSESIFLGEEREHTKADTFIYQYLQEHLKFEVNNKPLNFSFIGKEMDNDVEWVYLEIENVKSFNSLTVHCSLLIDEFKDQNNIIQVNKLGVVKNLLLNDNDTNGTVSFD